MEPIKKISVSVIGLLLLGAGLESFRPRAHESPFERVEDPRIRASFAHGSAEHRKLQCGRCHSISPARPDVEVFPGHTACIACHNFALEALRASVAFCGICHAGQPLSKSRAALFDFPKQLAAGDFGIDFSHPAHLKPDPGPPMSVSRESRRCTACHKPAGTRAADRELTLEKGHSSCFVCHGDKPKAEPGMFRCAECHHVDGPRFASLSGTVADFRHPDHEFDTRPKRKRDLQRQRRDDFLCVECHSSVAKAERPDQIKLPAPAYCAECHNGRAGLPEALAQKVLESLTRR